MADSTTTRLGRPMPGGPTSRDEDFVIRPLHVLLTGGGILCSGAVYMAPGSTSVDEALTSTR